MADNCVSLARTNTLSSTITKLIKTSFHYYSLVLNKARHADDGYKNNGPREASAGLQARSKDQEILEEGS